MSIDDDSRLYRLGIREHTTIESVNDMKTTNEDLIEIMTTQDSCTLEVQVNHTKYIFQFHLAHEIQPLSERTVWFRRTKMHNDKPRHKQIMRQQFPLRLLFAMTINKSQGKQQNALLLTIYF